MGYVSLPKGIYICKNLEFITPEKGVTGIAAELKITISAEEFTGQK